MESVAISSKKLSDLSVQPLVVIVGETGSGKSALAINLAEKFSGELICADALTVRKAVDIGTAKPSAEDRLRVPHHLLDVVEPCEDFTAAVFKRLANTSIEEISSRGNLPIMVGGTGLYIDSVVYDYSFLPAGDRKARQELNALDISQLRELIKSRGLDDSGVDLRNKRRLIRLLETDGARPSRHDIRPRTLILGLSLSREDLKQHIANRTEQMLAQGLEKEVETLAEKYGWECEALKAIGYREWRAYFMSDQNIQETKNKIIKSTLDLAKKQRTWFKRNKSIQWLNHPSNAVDIITTFLNN